MSSSFGADSAVLLHLATRVLPRIKVIFVDTGYLFSETHAFMEALRRRLDLNIWAYRTRNDPAAYLAQAGEGAWTWRNDVERCCAANKNEPFERAMGELRPLGWLRGIRRQQSETRARVGVCDWSGRYNCWAISPIAAWTRKQVHDYLKEHDLPYHPLVEKGYTSIGCSPESCTRPITDGGDERGGRWAGTDKKECGLNI